MASDILTLNSGSSSLKFSLWQAGTDMELRELFRGEIEKIGIAPHLSAREPGGRTVIDDRFDGDGAKLSHEDLLRGLFAITDDPLIGSYAGAPVQQQDEVF